MCSPLARVESEGPSILLAMKTVGETSVGKPAGLERVNCTVILKVQTVGNDAEDEPVKPPGVLSSVLPSITRKYTWSIKKGAGENIEGTRKVEVSLSGGRKSRKSGLGVES